MLRGPTSPDPLADRGAHDIRYALRPHAGDWRAGNAPRAGDEYNYKLIPLVTTPRAGSLPATHSFYSTEPENVTLATVKKAEDDDDVVIRLVETEGRDGTTAVVKLPFKPKSAVEVNLIEDVWPDGEPGTLDGDTLTVPMGRFEIKTIKLSR